MTKSNLLSLLDRLPTRHRHILQAKRSACVVMLDALVLYLLLQQLALGDVSFSWNLSFYQVERLLLWIMFFRIQRLLAHVLTGLADHVLIIQVHP